MPTCYTCGVQHIACWQCGIGSTARAHKRRCVQPCNWLRIFCALLLLSPIFLRCLRLLTLLLHSRGAHAFLWVATYLHSHTNAHAERRMQSRRIYGRIKVLTYLVWNIFFGRDNEGHTRIHTHSHACTKRQPQCSCNSITSAMRMFAATPRRYFYLFLSVHAIIFCIHICVAILPEAFSSLPPWNNGLCVCVLFICSRMWVFMEIPLLTLYTNSIVC